MEVSDRLASLVRCYGWCCSSKLQFGVVVNKSEYKILSGERFAYVDVEPDLNIGYILG